MSKLAIPPEAIQNFQKIYKEEFGININREIANDLGGRLLSLIKKVYKPIPMEGKNGKLK